MKSEPEEILAALRASDRDNPMSALVLSWPALERIRARGGVVVVKLDGERRPADTGPYTIVISAELLGDEAIRIDGETLADALHSALTHCPTGLWT